ncbi:hypothetical protein CDEST_00801 [Colletotrichum destructivum]|uniref:Uncharacterized protein n=1 Tax=Colletotrichum destructivum TaxID=34406 RepID=A0AAX4HXJ1_9PEZI|nr:hypothetical protein CDEST_00801 [Colletotrichum destructivum]
MRAVKHPLMDCSYEPQSRHRRDRPYPHHFEHGDNNNHNRSVCDVDTEASVPSPDNPLLLWNRCLPYSEALGSEAWRAPKARAALGLAVAIYSHSDSLLLPWSILGLGHLPISIRSCEFSDCQADGGDVTWVKDPYSPPEGPA